MRKIIRKRIRYEKDGVQISGDVNGVIATNVGQQSTNTSVRSTQRIVQRSANRKVGGKEARPKE